MKKVKILLASVLFCTMGYIGYTAYERMTMSSAEKFMKANVEALATPDQGDGGYESTTCYNGGPGATSCSIDGGIDIAGSGVSVACSVSCGDGYYACCGVRCVCIICDI